MSEKLRERWETWAESRFPSILKIHMDVGMILKVAGVGLTVSIAYQLLSKYGRDEQAVLVSLAGIVIVMLMLVDKIGTLFGSVRSVFGF